MDQKLTTGTKFRYGLADLGFALITSAMQFFLLFYYTDVAGINPALAGSALMVGKLTWDAINDPLFGYISDRTRSRFGAAASSCSWVPSRWASLPGSCSLFQKD